MARVAATGEFRLVNPMIAIDTATCRRSLRQQGIGGRDWGRGSLMQDY